MPRTAYIKTTNEKKFREYRAYFDLYGINVIQVSPECPSDDLLEKKKVVGVFREESNLVEPGTKNVLERPLEHGQVAENFATLTVETENGSHVYQERIEGYIDCDRRSLDNGEVFDWDDVFVVATTGKTYEQMRQRDLKRSARDRVLAQFAREHLWYSEGKSLQWFDQVSPDRSIDFSLDPVEFFSTHQFYQPVVGNEEPFDDSGIGNIIRRVINDGLFFRSALNRREKIYWLPGLNAGLPFTPKRDSFHEATFMAHDVMHFAFPDLVFDGGTDEESRRVYIAHRMMSEAFTLVLADMVFVDGWKRRGFDYDFSKRRIHPLYETGDWDSLEQVLKANVDYCLKADDSGYREAGVDPKALERFKDKYEQFFISDYRWTENNFGSMTNKAGFVRPWSGLAKELRTQFGLNIETVSEFKARLETNNVDLRDRDDLVDAVFGEYISRFNRLRQSGAPQLDSEQCRTNAFRRHMIGQMAMFYQYDFAQSSDQYSEVFRDLLLDKKTWSLGDIDNARSLLGQYLKNLHQNHHITSEERDLFAEIFPIFDPFYVAYDSSTGETLKQAYEDIL